MSSLRGGDNPLTCTSIYTECEIILGKFSVTIFSTDSCRLVLAILPSKLIECSEAGVALTSAIRALFVDALGIVKAGLFTIPTLLNLVFASQSKEASCTTTRKDSMLAGIVGFINRRPSRLTWTNAVFKVFVGGNIHMRYASTKFTQKIHILGSFSANPIVFALEVALFVVIILLRVFKFTNGPMVSTRAITSCV